MHHTCGLFEHSKIVNNFKARFFEKQRSEHMNFAHGKRLQSGQKKVQCDPMGLRIYVENMPFYYIT